MKPQREEAKVADDVAASPPKLTMVVMLAVLVGILLTAISGAVFFYYQRSAAFDAEVVALRDELKIKSVALDDMQAQNASLAKHVNVLKGYSIASSVIASEKAIKAESPAAATAAADSKAAVPATPPAPPQTPVALKAKKAKAPTQDCELVGKSPDEQAATLRRCVGLLDSPSAKPRQ